MNAEFYIYNNELWCMTAESNRVVTEQDTELISMMIERIREQYPEAYQALEKAYAKSRMNVPYFQFKIVNRFCRCNFGELDCTKEDITNEGFNFEKVTCPMRGECALEGIVCMPKFNTKISDGEMRVMRLVYEGLDIPTIAEQLYLSPNTIKNHIKSVYRKLGIHEKADFIRYANTNKLF